MEERSAGAAPVAQTTAGRVRGTLDEGISVFKGIPDGTVHLYSRLPGWALADLPLRTPRR
jgi:hypothetical protein